MISVLLLCTVRSVSNLGRAQHSSFKNLILYGTKYDRYLKFCTSEQDAWTSPCSVSCDLIASKKSSDLVAICCAKLTSATSK